MPSGSGRGRERDRKRRWGRGGRKEAPITNHHCCCCWWSQRHSGRAPHGSTAVRRREREKRQRLGNGPSTPARCCAARRLRTQSEKPQHTMTEAHGLQAALAQHGLGMTTTTTFTAAAAADITPIVAAVPAFVCVRVCVLRYAVLSNLSTARLPLSATEF